MGADASEHPLVARTGRRHAMGRIIVSGKSQLFDDVSVRDADCRTSA
jgi:hypothetical protein